LAESPRTVSGATSLFVQRSGTVGGTRT
jgi:hypothetical protein